MRKCFSVAFAAMSIFVSTAALSPAATVKFDREIPNAGAAATTTYGTVGYDLYATTPVGTNTPTNTAGPFSTGTRRTSLPGFVTSITGPSSNLAAAGFNFYSTLNNPAGGQVEAGFTYASSSTTGSQKDLVSITLGQNPPASFDIGLVTNVTGSVAGGGASNDYDDDFRVRQVTGGTGDSGLILTGKAAATLGGVDVYFFQIAGAAPGDVFTVSGIENGRNNDQGDFHATLNATLFPTASAVPEPASFGVLCLLGLVMLGRYRADGSPRRQ